MTEGVGGNQNHGDRVVIIQKQLPNQFLKVAAITLFQKLPNRLLHGHAFGRISAVEPGVQQRQRFVQASGRTAAVTIPHSERKLAQAGIQTFLIQALLYNLRKGVVDCAAQVGE